MFVLTFLSFSLDQHSQLTSGTVPTALERRTILLLSFHLTMLVSSSITIAFRKCCCHVFNPASHYCDSEVNVFLQQHVQQLDTGEDPVCKQPNKLVHRNHLSWHLQHRPFKPQFPSIMLRSSILSSVNKKYEHKAIWYCKNNVLEADTI